MSIIGRFLEHSRVFYFYNNGAEEIYIGSADWMRRNLDKRVEVITPIEDPEIICDLQEILGVMLADDRQAWDLQADGSYLKRHAIDNIVDGENIDRTQSAQSILMEMALHSNRI
jgi:polyphosphate kinase